MALQNSTPPPPPPPSRRCFLTNESNINKKENTCKRLIEKFNFLCSQPKRYYRPTKFSMKNKNKYYRKD